MFLKESARKFDSYIFVRGPLNFETNCFLSVLHAQWSFDEVTYISQGVLLSVENFDKVFSKEMNLIIEANMYIWIRLRDHFWSVWYSTT